MTEESQLQDPKVNFMVIENSGAGKTCLIQCFITGQNQMRQRNMRQEHVMCTMFIKQAIFTTKVQQLKKNINVTHVKDVADKLITTPAKNFEAILTHSN